MLQGLIAHQLLSFSTIRALPDSGQQQRVAVAEARGAVTPHSSMGPRQAARCGRLTPAPLLEIREARSCTTPVDTIHENPRPQFFWSKARRKLSRQAVTLLRRRTAIMARHRSHRSSNGICIAICRASATASGS